jgi:hypothetical protein
MSTRPLSRMPWRWLWDSPMFWSVWACVGLAFASLGRVGRAVAEAEAVRARAEAVLAATVADEAAVRMVGHGIAGPGVKSRVWISELPVDVAWFENRFVIEVETGSARHRFSGQLHPGAAPACLGRALTASDTAVLPPGLDAVREPLGSTPLASRDARSAIHSGLQRDSSIALLRLLAGTECDDYRLGEKGSRAVKLAGVDGGVVRVPGHLWVDSGAEDLTLDLDSDLTMVVEGNIYLGRTVRVRGGRLFLVAVPVGGPHCGARDGGERRTGPDCRRAASTAALEGSGNAWFGLPGVATGHLEVEAAVFVGGRLHLVAEQTSVHGSLVLAEGAFVIGREREALVATGSMLLDIERESAPGFLTTGRPRPGRIRPMFRPD